MNVDIKGVNLLGFVKNEVTRSRHPAARRLPTFYPSSASVELEDGTIEGGCWRADWYRVNQVKPSNPSEFYISMIHRLGKAVEIVVVDSMKEAGIFESAGVKFYDPSINVSGELDIVGRYRTKSDNRLHFFGVEVKSVYGNGCTETITGRSRAWKGQSAFRPKPKTSNLLQVITYLDQFSKARGDEFWLEGFKLVYLPRDKPNDGREYTIVLVTKEDISNEAGLAEFLPNMKDGERYALIMTEGFDDYVEVRFSLEDMYGRWRKQKELFESDTAPDRAFEKSYSAEKIEAMYAAGDLAETTYQDWKKGKASPGHYLCQSYCEYRDFCYTRQGNPRKEADSLSLVSIREPKEVVNE